MASSPVLPKDGVRDRGRVKAQDKVVLMSVVLVANRRADRR